MTVSVKSGQNGKNKIQCVCIPIAYVMSDMEYADKITKDNKPMRKHFFFRSEEVNQRE